MRRSISTFLLALPLALSLQSCGGDFSFGDARPGLYSLSYDRDVPASRGTVSGDLMVSLNEKGDVEFVLHDGAIGHAYGAGEVDDQGHFTASTNLPLRPGGRGLVVNVEGEINGSGAVNATLSGDIIANVSGDYFSDGTSNPFAADYDGVMTGSLTNIIDLDVAADGSVTGTIGSLALAGTGTIQPVGNGTIEFTPGSFRGTTSITFYAFFYLHEGERYASGTYIGTVNGESVSGEWTATRD